MESMVRHPTANALDELVQEYCKEAEGRIMIAHSLPEAMRIKEQWCNRFRTECESELLINAASAYLDVIITRQWNRV